MTHDWATGFDDAVASKGKTAADTDMALTSTVGSAKVDTFYSDADRGIKRAVDDRKWKHLQSTPYDPQNNSIIERTNKTAVEGARCLLKQSGLPT